MTRLLLTNDDGVDSPALVPFARALGRTHDVDVVVPDGERSWIGKALTRHGDIGLHRTARDGLDVWTTTGTPADACQLGLHALDQRADVVVSGINVGYNHSTAFLMSSGTVGAAVEAHLAGAVGIAFSTGTIGDWPTWRAAVDLPEAQAGWASLAQLCAGLLDELLASGITDHADVVSVNLPFEATADTPRVLTGLARSTYGQVLRRSEDGRTWQHALGGLTLDPAAGDAPTDVEVARSGGIAITPVRLPSAGPVPREVRRRLERP